MKDECGKTHANASDGVTTKIDGQLGTVVSLNTKTDSLKMRPLKSRCIIDPSYCEEGITIEFWLKFLEGKMLLSLIVILLLWNKSVTHDNTSHVVTFNRLVYDLIHFRRVHSQLRGIHQTG